MIVLRMSGASGREILSGIFDFMRMNPSWQTRLFQMPSEFTADILRALIREGYDGVIASENGPGDSPSVLRASNLPVAFIGDPGPVLGRRRVKIAHIRNDDNAIGQLGARFLSSLGNRRSFGFVPTVSSQYWSLSRQEGFTEELRRRNLVAHVFHSPGPAGSPSDCIAMRTWLSQLPKPTAIMASWDTRATQILQACAELKIKVPDQAAILGVDNDTLLCESTTPPLTSIMPDHVKLGFVAARELARLMRGLKASAPFRAPPKQLVERESAEATVPAAHIITRATSFIRSQATKGIRVDDVVRFLGISRRLADLRFREFAGETINEMIIRYRLDAVKKLLATTDRSIAKISASCGYTDLVYLKILFKRRFGVSMRDWRKANRSPSLTNQ